jgi:putative protease
VGLGFIDTKGQKTKNKDKKMEKIELVAPAGGINQLKAAIAAGADGIYLGYEGYNARSYAQNFNLDELKFAVSYSHSKNVKAYLTFNTIIKEKELSEVINLISNILLNIDFDGIIIQDLALLKIIKNIKPDIPVHASTQMNIHNSLSLEFLKKIGIERTILAREMTFEEMSLITKKDIMDIEIFCHGSQCYSYSGQCYFSSFVGGKRSGNRGTCPQPCRMKYEFIAENEKLKGNQSSGYLLSKCDLILLHRLPEIINAGVRALKIEGRMKTPEYVGVVTKIYRNYIDLYYKNPSNYVVAEDDLYKIRQIFSRDMNEGYFLEQYTKNIISFTKSGSTGNFFGRILKIESNDNNKKNNNRNNKNKNNDDKNNKGSKFIYVKSNIQLSKNDILEVWTKKGNERIVVKDFSIIEDMEDLKSNKKAKNKNKNETKKDNKKLYKIKVPKKCYLGINDRIFKYFDYKLDREAKSLYEYEAKI